MKFRIKYKPDTTLVLAFLLNFLCYSWLPFSDIFRGLLFILILMKAAMSSRVTSDLKFYFIFILAWCSVLLITPHSTFLSIGYVLHFALSLCAMAVISLNYSKQDIFRSFFYSLRILSFLHILSLILFREFSVDNIFGDDDAKFGFQLSGILASSNYFYLTILLYISSILIAKRYQKDLVSYIDLLLIILTIIFIIQYPLVNRTALATFVLFMMFFSVKSLFLFTFLTIGIISYYGVDLELIFKFKDLIEYGLLGNRAQLWAAALSSVFDNSVLIFGFGVGNEIDFLQRSMSNSNYKNLHAHSSVFSSLIELGVFKFFIFWVVIFLCILANMYRMNTIQMQSFLLLVVFIPAIFFDTVILKSTNILFLPFFLLFILPGKKV